MFFFATEAEAANHAENFLLGNPEFTGYKVFDCIHGWTYTVFDTDDVTIGLEDLPF